MTTASETQRAAILEVAAEMPPAERAVFDKTLSECEAFFSQFTVELTDENGPALLGFSLALLGIEGWLRKTTGAQE